MKGHRELGGGKVRRAREGVKEESRDKDRKGTDKRVRRRGA